MKIVSTFHPSSSVISSVKCQLASRDLEHLVVARLNRIDVYSLRANGLHHECGLEVWGKICSIKALKLSAYEGRSNIVLMITHPDPELLILSYNERETGTGELIIQKQISLFERSPRLAEFFTNFLIHPSGKLAVVSCYAGKLKIITLKGGQYEEEFDVSMAEMNIFSLTFLPTSDEDYALAILYLDLQGRLLLCARDIDLENLELSSHYSTLLQPTIISEKVVPYPTDSPPWLIPAQPTSLDAEDAENSHAAFLGGVLVVGGRQVLLFDLASKQSQEKQKGKQKRLESKKKSLDPAEVAQARSKERERESRKRKPKASVEWPWSEVSAWCAVEQVSARFLIGDSFGRLAMLSLENLSTLGMILVPLGETSQPRSLTYLTNQIVYLGSHLGDSQLLQISPTPVSPQEIPILAVPSEIKTVSAGSLTSMSSGKGKEKALTQDDMDIDDADSIDHSKGRVVEPMGSFVNVLDSYKNLAPIMDAILVDTDGTGQNQVVTCSGGANTGTVNVVRNGAGFREMAFVSGLIDITRIWSVRTMFDDKKHSRILVSTVSESHLFKIEEAGGKVTLKRMDFGDVGGLITNEPTLAFSNFYRKQDKNYVNSSLVVQIIPNGAFMLEWDSTMDAYVERAKWDVRSAVATSRALIVQSPEVVAACVNASQAALALAGGDIVFLFIDTNRAQFKQYSTYMTKSEISVMSLSPPNLKSAYSMYLTVAYWETNIVEILEVGEPLKSKFKSSPLPSVVRSLLLYNFGNGEKPKEENYHAFLLAGLGDGSVVIMSWNGRILGDMKTISLGHAPVSLTHCVVDGRKSVFASGNRATVFFYDKGRLLNSPIMLREISASSSLNTESFPSSIILASPTGLFIGCINDLNKMHIRTASFGLDNPRRIVHEPSLKVYGVSCTRTEPARIGGYEQTRSSFHILDDNTLSVLGQYKCEPDEEITAVVSFTSIVEGVQKPFFCLGTFVFNQEDKEPTLGRLLIFSTFGTSTKVELALMASEQVRGCVVALKIVGEKIVAAVNSSILLYHLEINQESLAPIYSLRKVAEWNHNYMVTSLGSFEDRVVAGDQISSVSLLKVTEDKLVSEARDYGPLYPVAVEALDSTNLICSNDALNIASFTLGKNLRGEALERIGFYHVADMVSKFLRGAISATDSARESELKPETMFFTSSGRISAIIDVRDNELSLSLSELQRNLAAVVTGAGGVSHTRFRAPKNTRGASDADTAAYGFVDGDFLEQYLGLLDAPEKLARVMEGGSAFEKLRMSQDEIIRFLEQLQSLH